MSPGPDLDALERQCLEFVSAQAESDAAHDLAHIKRVVNNARYLTEIEGARLEITLPAAWLHDCVQVPKNSPDRAAASKRAAAEAERFLAGIGYPGELLPEVGHAVAAHSWSAGIAVRSIEAGIVQDADRLDALGALGIARCLLTGGAMGSALYHPGDPWCSGREPDDSAWVVDHFHTKLLRLPATMCTDAGRREAERRADIMREFLDELGREAGLTDRP